MTVNYNRELFSGEKLADYCLFEKYKCLALYTWYRINLVLHIFYPLLISSTKPPPPGITPAVQSQERGLNTSGYGQTT